MGGEKQRDLCTPVPFSLDEMRGEPPSERARASIAGPPAVTEYMLRAHSGVRVCTKVNEAAWSAGRLERGGLCRFTAVADLPFASLSLLVDLGAGDELFSDQELRGDGTWDLILRPGLLRKFFRPHCDK